MDTEKTMDEKTGGIDERLEDVYTDAERGRL